MRVPYDAEIFLFHLAAANGKDSSADREDAGKGIVRDFVWKMTGLRPVIPRTAARSRRTGTPLRVGPTCWEAANNTYRNYRFPGERRTSSISSRRAASSVGVQAVTLYLNR